MAIGQTDGQKTFENLEFLSKLRTLPNLNYVSLNNGKIEIVLSDFKSYFLLSLVFDGLILSHSSKVLDIKVTVSQTQMVTIIYSLTTCDQTL